YSLKCKKRLFLVRPLLYFWQTRAQKYKLKIGSRKNMQQRSKKLIVIISICCTTILLLSCRNDKESDRDHLVFRYNEHGNIPTLDPAFARNPQAIWPDNQLYNGLVQLDDSLNIEPDIAKSWIINDSTNTYTFFLRNDVFFHQNKA